MLISWMSGLELVAAPTAAFWFVKLMLKRRILLIVEPVQNFYFILACPELLGLMPSSKQF